MLSDKNELISSAWALIILDGHFIEKFTSWNHAKCHNAKLFLKYFSSNCKHALIKTWLFL